MESCKVCRSDAEPFFQLEDREGVNFTSVNNDCMQLIFEHLEWKDLVNVVETCKSFQDAACEVFKRKYGGRKRIALGCRDK